MRRPTFDRWIKREVMRISKAETFNFRKLAAQAQRPNAPDRLAAALLLYANETDKGLVIEKVEMEPMKVYNIPTGLWHNTVTEPGVKLILVEDSACSGQNSDILDLTEAQLETVRALVG